MKKVLFTLTLCCLLAMPCILQAEEVVIPLFEVITMSPLPGDDPLDDPERSEEDPPRPTDFRATINSHSFSVTRLNSDILSAQATVVNATTGSVVVNEVFTESMEELIPNTGAYILNILTASGALTGQFLIQ